MSLIVTKKKGPSQVVGLNVQILHELSKLRRWEPLALSKGDLDCKALMSSKARLLQNTCISGSLEHLSIIELQKRKSSATFLSISRICCLVVYWLCLPMFQYQRLLPKLIANDIFLHSMRRFPAHWLMFSSNQRDSSQEGKPGRAKGSQFEQKPINLMEGNICHQERITFPLSRPRGRFWNEIHFIFFRRG